LGNHYANLCDDGFLAEELAESFTPDGIWTAEGFGPFEGREALIDFFNMLGAQSLFALHMIGNEEIDIDGDAAKMRWSAINVNTIKGDSGAKDDWIFLRYDNDLVRVDGEWKFKRMSVTIRATGAHDAGWSASVTSN
jgi:hypothetical protein